MGGELNTCEGGKREPKITLTQSDKWMRQANVIDGKIITTTDTAIAFNKYRSCHINLESHPNPPINALSSHTYPFNPPPKKKRRWSRDKRRTMTYQEFLKYLEELSSCKSVDFNAVKLKLARCGRPTITKPIPVGEIY
ncbi:hypothetical protein AAG570_013363 [Ranatra chinensis]|uniref:Uncharacterized protein n=1 Tax=Ranatra chinensis TaxID=642074 RepID=A0ABD0YCM4_9HEMI